MSDILPVSVQNLVHLGESEVRKEELEEASRPAGNPAGFFSIW